MVPFLGLIIMHQHVVVQYALNLHLLNLFFNLNFLQDCLSSCSFPPPPPPVKECIIWNIRCFTFAMNACLISFSLTFIAVILFYKRDNEIRSIESIILIQF